MKVYKYKKLGYCNYEIEIFCHTIHFYLNNNEEAINIGINTLGTNFKKSYIYLTKETWSGWNDTLELFNKNITYVLDHVINFLIYEIINLDNEIVKIWKSK